MNLELKDASGKIVSRNFYWFGVQNSSYRRLNRLPAASLSATAKATRTGENIRVRVDLKNTGTAAALEQVNSAERRRRVAFFRLYYTDNYGHCFRARAGKLSLSIPRNRQWAPRKWLYEDGTWQPRLCGSLSGHDPAVPALISAALPS